MLRLLVTVSLFGTLSLDCCLATPNIVGETKTGCNESKLQEIAASLLKQQQHQMNQEKLTQQLSVKVAAMDATTSTAHTSLEKNTRDISYQLSAIQGSVCGLTKEKEAEFQKRLQNVESILGITFGQDGTTCAAGFRPFQSKCYHFGIKAMTWYTAKTACEDLGAKLVSVETYLEDDFISKTIKSSPESASLNGYWTSGNNLRSRSYWIWDSTNKPYGTYKPWGKGQPDTTGQCMFYCATDDWNWHDWPCSQAYFSGKGVGFVCEKDA